LGGRRWAAVFRSDAKCGVNRSFVQEKQTIDMAHFKFAGRVHGGQVITFDSKKKL
jgi:hypothetical protein